MAKFDQCYKRLPGNHVSCMLTFPFECKYNSIIDSELIQWSKGLEMKDGLGLDMSKLFDIQLELLEKVFEFKVMYF